MIFQIAQHGDDPDELGFLLHKHPARVQEFDLKFGKATVFYHESSRKKCSATLLVEIDPVGLVRSRNARQGGWALAQYVNDRPYAASSFLSVAIGRVFGSALNATCKQRPELIGKDRNLEITIPVLPAPGGKKTLQRLFEPIGYEIDAEPALLDPAFPDWDNSKFLSATFRKRTQLHSALKQFFVLIPALDRAKHYWVGPEEIEKLLAKGQAWLADHPEKEWIASRYLNFRKGYANEALERLEEISQSSEPDPIPEALDENSSGGGEPAPEKVSLHSQRLDRVAELIAQWNPQSVLDLGCGEGKLLLRLLDRTAILRVVGMDADSRTLETAKRRLARRLPESKIKDRLQLLHSSLIYRDERLAGFDTAALVEVIEHLDPDRFRAMERSVFEFAAPRRVVVTTPNREYNALFENLHPNGLRHRDHRFEWTREEFESWCNRVAARYSYEFQTEPLGEEDEKYGPPSQLAIFVRPPSNRVQCETAPS